ncbi:transcriptional regulator (plasmid) [Burkholderia pyrrocinia]|uniref:winged helix-turn-helix domain-containing protein n=1 Tax=Burkholderia pyrrocinia TaxID=60550 RepID=UPI0038B4ACD9
MTTPSLCVIGDIAIDTQTRVLVNLADRAQKYLSCNEFQLLLLLVEGTHTKEALIERIWGGRGIVVTDASYYQLVTRLRHSFEAVGLARTRIRTIPRYGLELIRCPTPVTEGHADEPVDNAGEDRAVHEQSEEGALLTEGAEQPCLIGRRSTSVWRRLCMRGLFVGCVVIGGASAWAVSAGMCSVRAIDVAAAHVLHVPTQRGAAQVTCSPAEYSGECIK